MLLTTRFLERHLFLSSYRSSLISLVNSVSSPTLPQDADERLLHAAETLHNVKATFDAFMTPRIVDLRRLWNQRRPLFRLPNEVIVEIFKFLAMETEEIEDPDPDAKQLHAKLTFKRVITLTHV